MRNDSPSLKQAIASDAIAIGVEAGYNIFSQFNKLNEDGKKLYLYGRYDYYDSMYKTDKEILKADWCGRQRIAAGINYCPMTVNQFHCAVVICYAQWN